MGYSKSSPQREIHRNTNIPQKTGKNSNTQANLAPKGTGERTANRAYTNRRKEIIKIQAELNEIETRRTVEKINKPGIGSLKELIR